MRIDDYLARIAYSGPLEPTPAVLEALLRAHALHVPFENIDVQLGKRLTTEPDAAYDKIVTRKRGGWCYEQNGLFGWALSRLGFEVTRIAAAVMRAERGAVADFNHLALLVRTAESGERWLVDAGFGGSMISPIRLRAGTYEQHPFCIGLRRLDGDRWQFWEDAGDGEFSFDFATEPADEAGLARKCRYLQTSPDSGFVQSLVAQRRLPAAHMTLRGRVLSQVGPDGLTSRVVGSPGELTTLLRDRFHLDVPEVSVLWPRIKRRHADWLRAKEPPAT